MKYWQRLARRAGRDLAEMARVFDTFGRNASEQQRNDLRARAARLARWAHWGARWCPWL